MIAPLKIKFQIVDEFLSELKKDWADIDNRIVRVWSSYVSARDGSSVSVRLIAQAVIRGWLVELSASFGHTKNPADSSDPAMNQLELARASLMKSLHDLQLDVRMGAYCPAGPTPAENGTH